MRKSLLIQTPVLKIAALEFGQRSSLPMLGLHGWLDNAMTFSGLGPLLSNVHLMALDFPGHGHSDHRPPGYLYQFVDYVADVIDVANKLGIDKFDLIGHSMGAGVATMIAGAVPDRVKRLILIDGIGPVTKPAADAADIHARSLSERHKLLNPQKVRVFPDIDMAVAARLIVGRLSPSSARAIVSRNLISIDEFDDNREKKSWMWRSDPRLRLTTPLYFTETQIQSHLEKITAKVLAIKARNDAKETRFQELIAIRAKHLQDVTLVEMPGEHHLHLDDPESIAPVINQFLSDKQS